MNEKCILIHLDRGGNKFRLALNNFQCLYTIYYLQNFFNIDVVVHSVGGTGDFLKDFQFRNLKLIDALEINFPIRGPFFTRLYSLIHPVVQKYGECIMFDNDLRIQNMEKVQELFDQNVVSGTIGHEYIGKEGVPCLWFGFVKINMDLVSKKINEQLITDLERKYKELNWHNNEERLWVQCLREMELEYDKFENCPYCPNKWRKESKPFIHYGGDDYFSNKVENCLRIAGDKKFMEFIFLQNKQARETYFNMLNQISQYIVENYRGLIKGQTKNVENNSSCLQS